MEGTLNALQTSVGSSISQGIAGLQVQIDELKQQLANVASEEYLNAINENLTGVNEDLEELLQSSNVFSGDLVISSDATLEFAEALGDKVAIVNGNVDITLQTAMDNDRIQAVANKFKTITGNLRVRAVAATVAPIQFDSLVGVNDLTIAQKDHFIFPELVSAVTITLGEK